MIVVIATDAPLLPNQLKRIARRASLGIARNGGTAGSYSGERQLCITQARPAPGANAASFARTTRRSVHELRALGR